MRVSIPKDVLMPKIYGFNNLMKANIIKEVSILDNNLIYRLK